MLRWLNERAPVAALLVAIFALVGFAVAWLDAAPTDEWQAAHVVKQTAMARQWADMLTIRVRWLSCEASGSGRCAIVPDVGAPFVALCSHTACSLEACRGAP